MARNSVVARVVVAGLIGLGFAVLWGFVMERVTEMAVAATSPGHSVERLFFREDGTPLLGRYEYDGRDWSFRDLDGRPASADARPGPPAPDAFRSLDYLPVGRSSDTRGDFGWDRRVQRVSFTGTQAWFVVTDGEPQGTAYFVGYDTVTRGRLGYLGLAGLRPDLPPSEERLPCGGPVGRPGDRVITTGESYDDGRTGGEGTGRALPGSVHPADVFVLGHDGRVYHVDLQARSIEPFADLPPARSAVITAGPRDPGESGTRLSLAVRSDDAVRLTDTAGRVRARFPIPEVLRDEYLGILPVGRDRAVMAAYAEEDPLADTLSQRVFQVGPNGTIREDRVTLYQGQSMRTRLALMGPMLPSPAPLALASVMTGRFAPRTGPGEGLQGILKAALPGLVVAGAVAVFLAALTYRRQVRYGASAAGRVGWTLVVLLFGLPAWVGYRFGREWPALETCPGCGTQAPVDREECLRCRTAFPGPARTGHEVFA